MSEPTSHPKEPEKVVVTEEQMAEAWEKCPEVMQAMTDKLEEKDEVIEDQKETIADQKETIEDQKETIEEKDKAIEYLRDAFVTQGVNATKQDLGNLAAALTADATMLKWNHPDLPISDTVMALGPWVTVLQVFVGEVKQLADKENEGKPLNCPTNDTRESVAQHLSDSIGDFAVTAANDVLRRLGIDDVEFVFYQQGHSGTGAVPREAGDTIPDALASPSFPSETEEGLADLKEKFGYPKLEECVEIMDLAKLPSLCMEYKVVYSKTRNVQWAPPNVYTVLTENGPGVTLKLRDAFVQILRYWSEKHCAAPNLLYLASDMFTDVHIFEVLELLILPQQNPMVNPNFKAKLRGSLTHARPLLETSSAPSSPPTQPSSSSSASSSSATTMTTPPSGKKNPKKRLSSGSSGSSSSKKQSTQPSSSSSASSSSATTMTTPPSGKKNPKKRLSSGSSGSSSSKKQSPILHPPATDPSPQAHSPSNPGQGPIGKEISDAINAFLDEAEARVPCPHLTSRAYRFFITFMLCTVLQGVRIHDLLTGVEQVPATGDAIKVDDDGKKNDDKKDDADEGKSDDENGSNEDETTNQDDEGKTTEATLEKGGSTKHSFSPVHESLLRALIQISKNLFPKPYSDPDSEPRASPTEAAPSTTLPPPAAGLHSSAAPISAPNQPPPPPDACDCFKSIGKGDYVLVKSVSCCQRKARAEPTVTCLRPLHLLDPNPPCLLALALDSLKPWSTIRSENPWLDSAIALDKQLARSEGYPISRIVMEYYKTNGYIPVVVVKCIWRAVVKVLEACRARGIVHGNFSLDCLWIVGNHLELKGFDNGIEEYHKVNERTRRVKLAMLAQLERVVDSAKREFKEGVEAAEKKGISSPTWEMHPLRRTHRYFTHRIFCRKRLPTFEDDMESAFLSMLALLSKKDIAARLWWDLLGTMDPTEYARHKRYGLIRTQLPIEYHSWALPTCISLGY